MEITFSYKFVDSFTETNFTEYIACLRKEYNKTVTVLNKSNSYSKMGVLFSFKNKHLSKRSLIGCILRHL